MKACRVGILGATGAVGAELINCLRQRRFPVAQWRLLASERSAGKRLEVGGEDYSVEPVSEESFRGLDLVFMSAGATRSREWAPVAVQQGAAVIDNSSAFRLSPDVPLIVPEVNAHALPHGTRLVANPNCTAAILLMALQPLRQVSPMERVVVSTYQSASGAGAQAMEELREQAAAVLRGETPSPEVFPWPIAFNLFSHNSSVGEDGMNDEERKVIAESRKILELPDLRIGVTCVRVPVLRAHSLSVTVEFAGDPPTVEATREALERAPGVKVVDDAANNHFPMPIEASGQEDVLVGRIRHDPSHPRALSLFLCGDQLLKGAAQNAVQIAELLLARGELGN